MSNYIIWDVDPIIFSGIPFLRWYGCCWAVGMILGYQVMLKIYKREGLIQADLDKLVIYVGLGAIIGARLGHILFYDPVYYYNNPIEILPFKLKPSFQFMGLAGLASHGGVIGALVALYHNCKKYKDDFWWNLDRLTIGGALLGGFIRIGNLMNSEILGLPTDVSWAFRFIRIDDVPRHPAQLYEAVFYFLVALVLFVIWKSGKANNHKGLLIGLGVSVIFTQRFLMEFIKENQVTFENNFMLNMGQALSLPFIVVGILLMLWSLRKATRKQLI